MLIRIISLVFLLTFINYDFLLSGEKDKFIFPKDKPSIFKKIDQKRIEERNKAFQIPKEKPKENKEITKEANEEIKKKTGKKRNCYKKNNI